VFVINVNFYGSNSRVGDFLFWKYCAHDSIARYCSPNA